MKVDTGKGGGWSAKVAKKFFNVNSVTRPASIQEQSLYRLTQSINQRFVCHPNPFMLL